PRDNLKSWRCFSKTPPAFLRAPAGYIWGLVGFTSKKALWGLSGERLSVYRVSVFADSFIVER
ncbi:MAG: hypothetical protein RSH25_04670, partial [Bacteroides sp.]|uniref:hypothetical protein n=1 Tax=Bacteroides sp. TaxID=29523 RepID=UPI002FC6DEFC